MKWFVVGAALTLCGCATAGEQMLVYKQGTLTPQRSAELDACKIASFKEIPQTIATDVQGGYSSPGSVSCNTIGGYTYCQNIGGYFVPARSTSYDINHGMRDRYIARCLASRGYSVIKRPVCSSESEKDAYRKAIANGLPPADQIKCTSGDSID